MNYAKSLRDRFTLSGAPKTVYNYVMSMQLILAQAEIDERELVKFIVDGLQNRTPAVAMLYMSVT